MTNFAKGIITILKAQVQGAGWTETNPAIAKVKWPWKPSKSYLTDIARRGGNLIWAVKDKAEPRELEGAGPTSEMGAIVNVYCYARGMNNGETAVEESTTRAENAADQVRTIIKANHKSLTGATNMRPAGRFQMSEIAADSPPMIVEVVKVLVIYAE